MLKTIYDFYIPTCSNLKAVGLVYLIDFPYFSWKNFYGQRLK